MAWNYHHIPYRSCIYNMSILKEGSVGFKCHLCGGFYACKIGRPEFYLIFRLPEGAFNIAVQEAHSVGGGSYVVKFWTPWGCRDEGLNMAAVTSPKMLSSLSFQGDRNKVSKTFHHSSVTFYLDRNSICGLPPLFILVYLYGNM